MRFTSPHRKYGIILKPAKKVEIDGELVSKPGVHIQFENGSVVVDDPNIIKDLTASKWYGKHFISPEYEAQKQEAKIKAQEKKESPEKETKVEAKKDVNRGSHNRGGTPSNR